MSWITDPLYFTEHQIIAVIKSVEAGRTVKDVCREAGISEDTYFLRLPHQLLFPDQAAALGFDRLSQYDDWQYAVLHDVEPEYYIECDYNRWRCHSECDYPSLEQLENQNFD